MSDEVPLIVGLTVKLIPGVVVRLGRGREMVVICAVPGTEYKVERNNRGHCSVFHKVAGLAGYLSSDLRLLNELTSNHR